MTLTYIAAESVSDGTRGAEVRKEYQAPVLVALAVGTATEGAKIAAITEDFPAPGFGPS